MDITTENLNISRTNGAVAFFLLFPSHSANHVLANGIRGNRAEGILFVGAGRNRHSCVRAMAAADIGLLTHVLYSHARLIRNRLLTSDKRLKESVI